MRGELIHHETSNGEESRAILLSISSSLSLICVGFYVGFENLKYKNLYVQFYVDIWSYMCGWWFNMRKTYTCCVDVPILVFLYIDENVDKSCFMWVLRIWNIWILLMLICVDYCLIKYVIVLDEESYDLYV
jgi:hypothetical protein